MSLPWVRQCLDSAPCVLVTLRQNKGSSPRESGARMVVSESDISGSVGGGNLEHQAILTAREMLAGGRGQNCAQSRHPGNVSSVVRDPVSSPRLEPFGLGPHLNQCCGGSVELLFEEIASPPPGWLLKLSEALEHGDHAVLATATTRSEPSHYVALPVGRGSELPTELQVVVRKMLDDSSIDPIQKTTSEESDWWLERISRERRQLWLFGAGHVGKAVVRSMADLPFAVRWIDSRQNEFPTQVPDNVTIDVNQDLPGEVSSAPANATFIVMTHSHELDEDICHAVLARGDFAFLGMIGSRSKARRFGHRLGKRGIPEATLDRLICPIGLPNIAGKEPATIALSLAAQLMSQNKE